MAVGAGLTDGSHVALVLGVGARVSVVRVGLVGVELDIQRIRHEDVCCALTRSREGWNGT
ncbi:MAG: hypothetical protein ACI855_000949 [Myxococcota bacterium]